MRYTSLTFLVLAFAFSASSHARSNNGNGSIVGNGAGLVEQNIVFSYGALPSAIDSCLVAEAVCGVSAAEKKLLSEIRSIAAKSRESSDWIQIVSGAENPGFFDLEGSQPHRIAKTGLASDAPVYWNSDFFYAEDGSPALDLPTLAAIWVHELGHQTGSLDHAALDQIGAKIRLFLQRNSLSARYQDEKSEFELKVFNFNSYSSHSEALLSDGTQSISLTGEIASVLQCSEPFGWRVSHLRWDSRLIYQPDGSSFLPLSGWVKVYCQQGGELKELDQDIHIYLQFREQEGRNVFYQALPSDGHGD